MADTLDRLTASLSDRYRLERELGQGGMATVYLAEDLKHARKVAIKVLHPELSAVIGGERFLSEIKTTASLQHPHILGLIDSGEADGLLYYVMPFIEGETLRGRLTREKQLPVDDSIRLTKEVASALEFAHKRGIIHRDIKPENILLQDGQALVADFGIALAVQQAGGSRMTQTGMSLGTPAYMSPEQAMGERDIGARSDVYALGAMTYEMLTGEPPFTGPNSQAIVAKVLTEQPSLLRPKRPTVSPAVEDAVLTALQKLPADRWGTAKEFSDALDGGGRATGRQGGTYAATVPMAATRVQPARRVPLVALLAGTALISAGAAWFLRPARSAPALPAIRFIMSATDSTRPFANFPWPAAISPDGSSVVYSVGSRSQGGTMLYLLRTDQLTAHPIPGTNGGYQPYFSPDGGWLAFEGSGKERKVRLDGSAPVAIADATGANGADWTAGNEIIFGAQGDFHGLSHVSAAGGVPALLTKPDTAKGEIDHLWPVALPDGKTIAFAIWSGSLARARLALTSVDDGKVVPLGIAGIRPLALLDGMLVYVQADGGVMAVGLDLRGKRVRGTPIPVHDPVPVVVAFNGNSGVYISHGGGLVSALGGNRGTLVWAERDGRTEQVSPQARDFRFARLSPDERRIAVVLSQDGKGDVWIYDLALATFSRLTTVGTVTTVEWSADGSRVLFPTASGDEGFAVWSQLASGGTPADKVFQQTDLTVMATMAPDGKSLLVTSGLGDGWGLLRVALDSTQFARPYLTTKANQHAPQFSPDGKWVALVSDESGRDEVYVRSYPDPAAKIQVSVAGGGEPIWSRDGSRLYYLSGTSLLEARVSLSPTFALVGRDTVLTSLGTASYFSGSYQPTRDGKRVLAIQRTGDDFQLVVSPNWITEFRRRVAESGGGH